jgi:hypothetical protein
MDGECFGMLGNKGLLKRALDLVQILGCLDAYREAKGVWPTKDTPGYVGIRDESWRSIDQALRQGLQSLPGCSSLAKFIEFAEDVQAALRADPSLVGKVAAQLLEGHFPESIHTDIFAAVGLEIERTKYPAFPRLPIFFKTLPESPVGFHILHLAKASICRSLSQQAV